MLLMQLKTIEKFAFLHIAHHLARIDGFFGLKEKEIINDYCIEMGIDDIIYDEQNYSLDECLSKFKTQKSQKILLLELMILVHIDDKFNSFEKELMTTICTKFDIKNNGIQYASSWGKAACALREQGLLMINT
ncbi:hypothetical protein [Sulfurospirillum arcachonense]|uniref:hypothetical protein n=1 Tax=Sulfurospirillum arcachonense TaxID=57666 RepID=UPI000469BA42|nr:hypothetical protein [Sulfurospirillum arcachonense]